MQIGRNTSNLLSSNLFESINTTFSRPLLWIFYDTVHRHVESLFASARHIFADDWHTAMLEMLDRMDRAGNKGAKGLPGGLGQFGAIVNVKRKGSQILCAFENTKQSHFFALNCICSSSPEGCIFLQRVIFIHKGLYFPAWWHLLVRYAFFSKMRV